MATTHSLNLGGIGVSGNLVAKRLAKDTNLVKGISTRFADFTTALKQLFRHAEVDFLTINISGYHAHKFDTTTIIAVAKMGLIKP